MHSRSLDVHYGTQDMLLQPVETQVDDTCLCMNLALKLTCCFVWPGFSCSL